MSPSTTERSYLKIGLVILTFFVISFFTNILGALNPSVSESFGLNKTMISFLPFSFFIAYGVMSIPAGILVERYQEKKMLIAAFLICLLATVLFSIYPVFGVFLPSLFLIGASMAMLQVIINPLLRVSGGEEHYAFFSVMAQLAFGLASFMSPQLYTWVVTTVDNPNATGVLVQVFSQITPDDIHWVALYSIFAVISLLMIIIISVIHFSKVELNEEEQIGSKREYVELFKSKTVRLFFLGIFAYVGAEQGISYWMSKFLVDYHGVDFETTGASTVANYWGLMTIGGVIGLVLLKLFDSKWVLKISTGLTMIVYLLGLFGSEKMALYCLPATGFFMSMMYPIIISLALNSISKHHGAFAGILMTGIMGGAVIQLLIGGLADLFELQWALLINLLLLAYIFFIGVWAQPIVKNKTILSN